MFTPIPETSRGMKISVIVPAFNEEKLLAGVLENLNSAMRVLSAKGWGTELIVCDNNSTDSTAQIARHAGAVVVFEPVNQIARARNRGASVATGEWLIFVDADSWPGSGLFGEIAKELLNRDVVGGGAVIQFDLSEWWSELLVWAWNRLSRWKGWAAGSLVFCDAAAFRAVNGFNEEMFAAEEIDLSKRLQEWGRASGRGMKIITKFPMKTSSRKTRLYTPFEHLRFLVAGLFSHRKVMRDKSRCTLWYDGRR